MDKELLAKIEKYLNDNYIEPQRIDHPMSSRIEKTFDDGQQRRTDGENLGIRRKIHLRGDSSLRRTENERSQWKED